MLWARARGTLVADTRLARMSAVASERDVTLPTTASIRPVASRTIKPPWTKTGIAHVSASATSIRRSSANFVASLRATRGRRRWSERARAAALSGSTRDRLRGLRSPTSAIRWRRRARRTVLFSCWISRRACRPPRPARSCTSSTSALTHACVAFHAPAGPASRARVKARVPCRMPLTIRCVPVHTGVDDVLVPLVGKRHRPEMLRRFSRRGRRSTGW